MYSTSFFKLKIKSNSISTHAIRNGVEISLYSWVACFVPSFFFKIGHYDDIMTDFKGENRVSAYVLDKSNN